MHNETSRYQIVARHLIQSFWDDDICTVCITNDNTLGTLAPPLCKHTVAYAYKMYVHEVIPDGQEEWSETVCFIYS